ncbi:PREDICTED: breast cancer type 2 susceptibility protein [Elephantulus edwardii]|uniref:breast cancer type 2 susceptibility protein n=1 Tax=Elephantulus edwardii TaxID=28737 RepID=UPI0003F0E155|nr:PREDICTED: breast cancer type 2 susceptibility protein [Elephantulus edwardii]
MPVGAKESFFEIFKVRCSKADLGPVSLNWFEELTSEAPPYKPEPTEELECKVNSYEPSLFKTPQKKPYYNQLASTPIIFQDQGIPLLLYQSLWSCIVGKEAADSKQRSHSSKRARVDQARDMTSPPFHSCLSRSPLVRYVHITPQREKSVVCGSLFHTPKLPKGQTPKRISESLGAEVDPDMSWSSSLATPPTLSSTVLLAKDDKQSETVFPSDSTAISKHSFSNPNENLKKNKLSTPSLLDNENKNEEEGVSRGNLFDEVNSHDDHVGRSEPSVVEGLDTITDLSQEESFTFCVTKCKTGNAQKRKLDRKASEHEAAGGPLDREPEDSDPFCCVVPAQELTGSLRGTASKKAAAPSALEWSPLTLSGLNVTQVEKISSPPSSSRDKDSVKAEEDCALFTTPEYSRPQISRPPEAVVNPNCEGSQKDSIPVATQTASGTSPVTAPPQCLQQCLLQMSERLEQASGAVLPSDMADPDFTGEPETPRSGLKGDAAGSQSRGAFCPPAFASGSCPGTPKQPSVPLKNAGLISTLKKKTKKFIYSVCDEATCSGEKIQKDQESEATVHPTPFREPLSACAADSGLQHSLVRRERICDGTEEPALAIGRSLGTVLRNTASNESSFHNQLRCPGDGDVTSPAFSNRKEILSAECHPAIQDTEAECSGYHSQSQKTFSCHHPGASTLIAESSPKGPLPNIAEISREKETQKVSEKRKHKNCDAILDFTKNTSIEKNKTMSVFDEDSKKTELSPPAKCMTVPSSATKVKLNQNTHGRVIQKDQEERGLTSQIAVDPNSEELFPENKDDFVSTGTSEGHVTRECHEASSKSVKEPIVEGTAVLPADSHDRQTDQVLTVQDSDLPHLARELAEEDRRHRKTPLSQACTPDISLQTDRKSCRKDDHIERQVGLLGSFSNDNFRSGFKTASNKVIELSEHNVKKSKVLFKDIEEQYSERLACAEIVNTFPSGNEKKQNRPHAQSSPAMNPASEGVQGSAFEFGSARSCSAPQILPLMHDLSRNPSLTPSQKADISELSAILEDSGSQFEFTQFRKPSHVTEKNEVGRCRNQVAVLNGSSEGLQAVAVDIPANTLPTRHRDVKPDRAVGGEQKVAAWQKNVCGSTSSSLTGQNGKEPTGFCSARGTKICISSKALQRAVQLFSDIEDVGEDPSTPASPRGFSSSGRAAVGLVAERENLNGDTNSDEKCQLALQNTVEENTEPCERKTVSEENTCARANRNGLGDADGSNSSEKDMADSHRAEEGSPALTDEPSMDPKLWGQFTEEGNSDIRDVLSDLTCLEVVKAEETLHSEASHREQLVCIQTGHTVKDDASCHLAFQTAGDSPGKVTCSFGENAELASFAEPVNSELHSNGNNKMDSSNCEKREVVEKQLEKGSNLLGPENNLLTITQQPRYEVEKTRGAVTVGFRTASGKKVNIAKESLDKVKHLFEEKQADSEAVALKRGGGCVGGHELLCEALDRPSVSGSAETEASLGGGERILAPIKTMEFSSGNLHSHTDRLIPSTSISLQVEVHGNQGKKAAESPETCYTDSSAPSATENPALAFYTGHGRKISVTQTSLFEAKKWLREGEPEDQQSKRNTAGIICLKEDAQGYVGSLSCITTPRGPTENDRNNLTEKQDVDPLPHSVWNSPALYPDEIHSKPGCLSEKKLDSAGLKPVVANAVDKKSTSVSGAPSVVKADTAQQAIKEGTFALGLATNSPQENTSTAMSDARNLQGRPPAFSTASDKSCISLESITKDREMSAEQCCGVAQRKADPGHTASVAGHPEAPESSGGSCLSPSREGGGESSVHSCEILDRSWRTHVLHHHQSLSELEKVFQISPSQVHLQTPSRCQLNLGTLPKPVPPTDACGIFSTASGHSVHVSDASLQKARRLFSEIEDSATLPASKGPIQSDTEHSNKTATHAKLPSPQERPLSTVPHPAACSGFSTASGKQVIISDRALHTVQGMWEELDLMAAECHPLSPTSGQDGAEGLPRPRTDMRISKPLGSSSVGRTCVKEFQSHPSNTKCVSSENCLPGRVSPQPLPWKQDKQHVVSGPRASLVENIVLLGKEQTFPRSVKMNTGRVKASSNLSVGTSGDVRCTYAQDAEDSFETEAVEIAKAFMDDEELTDSELPGRTRRRPFTCPANEETVVFSSRVGKRRKALVSAGEPPIKRNLLNEFDRLVETPEQSLRACTSTPDGTIKDRRLFTHRISLKPVTCAPFCTTEERQEIQIPNFTAPGWEFLPKSPVFEHLALEKPAGSLPTSEKPSQTAGKPTKVFVPPFKAKPPIQNHGQSASKDIPFEENKEPSESREELGFGTGERCIDGGGIHWLHNSDSSQAAALPGAGGKEGPLDLIANLQRARDLQDARIKAKRQQRVCPQPGALYLAKTSSMPRTSLQAAVSSQRPSACTPQQLYMYGVPKHCMNITSRSAESFQFHVEDYFGKESLWTGQGVQLADGGQLIPSNLGKAGKEEFYRALCDTPGVDPKLISRDWVYNHYRWIVWKLAAMEVSFPQEFASRCLSPEGVLLQLKYRYDVEIDRSRRSAIRRILERDDTTAKTLVLCVSDILPLGAGGSETASSEASGVDPSPGALLGLTDGWYMVRAQLDPPLAALLKIGRLAVGQKIVTHGAELVGTQEACAPLEAPESLRLKISANSTRPARWYAKLGFHSDPRPFPLPLPSLFSDGGIVGCVDVVVQRVYPVQWMEKTSSGVYIFRDEREEEKEAAKYAEAQQRRLEALLSRVQEELEGQEENTTQRCLPSQALPWQQVRALQDGAELYEAVRSAPDPGYLESCLSEEQLRALDLHRQRLQERKQAQIQQEFRKAVEAAQHGSPALSRDVTAVWRLRLVDYRKKDGGSVMLSIWRPSSDLFSLLTEGKRFRIYHLATSKSKSQSERTGIQLTTTKKTRYQHLPASDEILLQVYQPRELLLFNKLLDPDFCPPCREVDLLGFVIAVVTRRGLAPLVYLSDECHHLLAIKFWTDLNEDVVKPPALIAASNLQWLPQASPGIPTLFARESTVVSASPKEPRFQEAASRLRAVENFELFFSEAEKKLMLLLRPGNSTGSTPTRQRPSELDAGPATPGAEHKVVPKRKSLPAPASAQKTWRSGCQVEKGPEDQRTLQKMRALDLLSRVPLPPPVSPGHTFVSLAAQKAFQPPRSCGPQGGTPGKGRGPVPPPVPPLGAVSEASPLGADSVADEELALLNTQGLASASGELPLRSAPDPAGTRPVRSREALRGHRNPPHLS